MPYNDKIADVLKKWQERLLQLDRRNNLLYFKPGRSAIQIVDRPPDDISEALISASKRGLSFDYVEAGRRPRRGTERQPDDDIGDPGPRVTPGDIRTDIDPADLQRRLRILRRRDKEWEEEQGLNVLFLAVGILEWIDEDGEDARSPLILIPCDLTQASPRDPYYLLRESDDAESNATLIHVALTKHGVALPEYGDSAPSEYLRAVAKAISKREGWRVTNEIYLGTFAYSKMPMVKDLERMRIGGVTHQLVRALAGDTEDPPASGDPGVQLPDEKDLPGGRLDDLLDVHDQYAVLRADFSQLRAIEAARSGAHLLIHGPPGTGKSQTIANIIATLLAEGKRVLFVSEKTAALDVVKRRLTECGLGVFCLDLHSERGKKSSVYEQLRESVEDPRSIDGRQLSYASLDSKRQQLNAVVRALHKRREPLGKTVFQMQGVFAKLQHLPRVDFDLIRANELDEGFLEEVDQADERIARRPSEFQEHTTSKWLPLTELQAPLGLADLIRGDMNLATKAVAALREELSIRAEWVGVPPPQTCSDAARLAELIDHLELGSGVPEGWLEPDTLLQLRAVSESQRKLQTIRREIIQQLTAAFGPDWRSIDFQELNARILLSREDQMALNEFPGATWKAVVVSPAIDLVRNAEAVAESTEDLLGRFGALTDGRWDTELGSWKQFRLAMENAACIARLAPVPEFWLEPSGLAQVRTALEFPKSLLVDLQETEDSLHKHFSDAIVTDVNDDLLTRYRVNYQGFWGRVGFSFRRDQRMLRGQQKVVGKLSVEDAIKWIELALDVRRLRDAWAEQEESLAQILGSRFNGKRTDWRSIEGELEEVEKLCEVWPAERRVLVSLLTDPEVPGRLRQALEACKTTQNRCADALEALSCADMMPEAGLVRALRDQTVRAAGPLAVLQGVTDELRPYYQRPVKDLDELASLVSSGVRLLEIEQDAAKIGPSLSSDFGVRFQGLDTDWPEVESALAWTEKLVSLVVEDIGEELRRRVVSLLPSTEYEVAADAVRSAVTSFNDGLKKVEARFDPALTPWGSWAVAPFVELDRWADDLSAHAETASGWIAYQNAVQSLNEKLGADVVSQIRDVTEEADLVPKIVRRRIVRAWLDDVHKAEPVLQAFASKDHNDLRLKFKELDRSLPLAARGKVRERCFSDYPSRETAGLSSGQYAILRGELARKRGQLPVRKLFARLPQLLQTLKPLFLMSPLAASKYLSWDDPADESIAFDAVIFDEASQVFPEDAIPAIARGKQTIIVGDEQQLPPSRFFERTFQDGDGDDQDDDDEDRSDALAGTQSILNAIAGMNVAEEYLKMHYRSRHESLIRYSNHYFYRDRLLVFPGPEASASGLGINDVYLPDARYDPKSNYPNRGEAERAVDELFHLLRSRPDHESVGIVALSRKQADYIQELVDQRRLLERDLEDRFAEDRREPIFVKNLENVQGDERDHIILSIGYGPTTGSGAVPNRFGPINLEGGERRLNVAVTRARRSMTVVHCLRHTDIHAESQGARLLQRFLEYIADPVRAFESAVTLDPAAETESPFEDAVEQAVIGRGYRVDRQVGVSGYRIDLAVLSEDGSRYDLGIECDGARYHSAPAARDRDWLRQSVLEGLGWTIYRVWSTAWIRNPEAELASIEASISAARSRNAVRNVSSNLIGAPDSNNDGGEADHPKAATSVDTPFEATRDEAPVLFDEYDTASLEDIKVGPELQHEVSPTLNRLVLRVVEHEMPVHLDQVIARIRNRYGLGRAGHIIRNRIEEAVRAAVKGGMVSWVPKKYGESDSTTFLIVDETETAMQPRSPRTGGPARTIDHICLGEIEAGLVLVVEAMFGGERESVILETARQFGYQRTGPDISRRIDEAISSLLDRGELVDANGMLVLSSEQPRGRRAENLPRQDGGSSRATALVKAVRSQPADASFADLEAQGLEVIDKRGGGGALWVVGGPELKNQLVPRGFKFADRGGRATKQRPAWYFVPETRSLPDDGLPVPRKAAGDLREQAELHFDIISFLRSQGFEVIDTRPAGPLWVIGGREHVEFFRDLESRGARFKFAASGRTVTQGRPAWYTYEG